MLRRILLAAIVFASCTTNEPSSQVTQAVTTSQSAGKIVSDLRSQFVLQYETPPAPEKAVTDDTPMSRTAPVFVASDVDKVQQTGTRLSPTLKSGTSSATLPDRAAGAIELSSGGANARVSLVGASSTAVAELGEGYIVYANGAPGGGHILHLATSEGVEDFVTFASAPQNAVVKYSLELVSGVAGLRLVENTLELLDAGGAPRLRVRPPYLVDSTGKGVTASLSVSGCSASTDPRAPWGEAVTVPGSNKCTVQVSWNNGDVTYPAVLDPSWSSTGGMTQARVDHTLTLLDNGKVLAAAGFKSGTLPGADLYDANTGTWAATGNPKKKRSEHIAVKLTNGKVLMAGGINGSTVQKVAELYNPATGTWSNTGSMATARRAFIAEILSNGKVLVSGGYSPSIVASAELYDPTPATWANTGAMATARAAHRSSVLANNNVMATGGIGTSAYQASAEIYSQSLGTWSTGGTMTTARAYHAQLSLAFDGRVVVGGGYTGTATTTSVDRWDPNTNSWSAAPALATARMKMGAALAGGAQVLFAAGLSGTTTLSSSELFQNYPPTVNARPALVTARSNFPLVRLADGRLLAAGGLQGSTYLSAAEIYDPSDPNSGDGLPEQNSPPKLSMEWDVEDPLGSYPLGTGTLGATVKNNTDTTRTAYIDVVSEGLDQREAIRSAYFNVTVPAWGSVALSVPMSVWPIRSVGTESEVFLKLREYVVGTGDTGFVDYTTERRYEVDISYTTLTLHGMRGKDLDRPQPPHAASLAEWLANFDAAKGDLKNLIGTIWNGSTFVELAAFAQQPNGVKGQYSWRGQLAGDIQDYFNSFVVDYVAPNGSPTYTLCARWRAKFIDASIGSQLTTTDHPASYAWSVLRVWKGSVPYIAWTGQLDQNGCTTPIQLEAGLWADFFNVTFLKNNTTGTVTRVEFGTNTITYVPVSGTSFTGGMFQFAVPNVGGSYTYYWLSEDFNTRSAAVVGRAMTMQDNGFADNTTYQVNSNTGCGCGQTSLYDQYCKPQEACGAGQTLGIGWVLLPTSSPTVCTIPSPLANCTPAQTRSTSYVRGQKHNTQYKAVIAHELGHCVQNTLSGNFRANGTAYDVNKPGAPPFQCSCDFVQEGNQLHCLQSREEQRNAMVEGYGHFYASRVTNDLAQSPCAFPYYKTVAVWEYNPNISGYAWDPKAPPYSVTCTGAAYSGFGWMENQCRNNGDYGTITSRGSEWDWLTFLYDVSRPGASGIPLTDPNSSSAGLTRIWRNACGNGSPTDCGTVLMGEQLPATTRWFNSFHGAESLQSSVNQLATGMSPQLTVTQKNNWINLGTTRGVAY